MKKVDHLTDLSNLAKAATQGGWIAVGTWVENTRNDLPDIVWLAAASKAKQSEVATC